VAGAVIDASVAVKWYLTESGSSEAVRLRSDGTELIAPATITLEVYNALWNAVRRKRAVPATLELGERTLPNLPWVLVGVDQLFARAAQLSRARQHSIFDCLYVALAERQSVPLVTADLRLFEIARRTRTPARML
jgi:predicted nucleic acid-binding protein